MLKLLNEHGSRELQVREYAMQRDGSIIVKVSDNTGVIRWVDAKDLEVLRI